jgi:HSP20 family protein
MFYRRLINPWNESEQLTLREERLQRQMARLFNTFGLSRYDTAPSFPAVNVYANEEAQIVTAELPGMKPEDIEISVVGETLTISGERKPEAVDENVEYHRQERAFVKFSRSFELLFPVESDKVEASFDNGVLRIHLPRAEAHKPRKIAIQAS